MKDVKEWVKEQLKSGIPEETIRQKLIKGGYDSSLIEEVTDETLIKEKGGIINKVSKIEVKKIILISLTGFIVGAIVMFFISSNITNISLKRTGGREGVITTAEEKIITSEPYFDFTLPPSLINVTQTPITFVSKSWGGNGVYLYGSLPEGSGNSGIILLPPINKTENVTTPIDVDPRYIVQRILLPENRNLVIKAKVTNVADYLNAAVGCRCADSVVTIKLVDEQGYENVVLDKIINASDGWQDISVDISKFAGKTYLLKIEGNAGGTCNLWCGEFTAVDEFYIVSR